MTPRQRQVMDFIEAYWAKHKMSPNYDEITKGIGGTKPNVWGIVKNLAKRGHLFIVPRVRRGIQPITDLQKAIHTCEAAGYMVVKQILEHSD